MVVDEREVVPQTNTFIVCRSLEHEAHQFKYYDGGVGELAVLGDLFVNVHISNVQICVDEMN